MVALIKNLGFNVKPSLISKHVTRWAQGRSINGGRVPGFAALYLDTVNRPAPRVSLGLTYGY